MVVAAVPGRALHPVTPRFHQDRSVRLEWWAVVAALVLLIGAMATREWLWRADQLLYDAALTVWQRPAPDDVVIVAIDDRSLAQVGRWPWRRAVHATLINRLTEDGAKAVGLDLLLSDRDAADAASDTSLAEAMQRSTRVVLPLVLAPTDRPELDDQLPLPEFAKVAQLGFAHVVIDADGIVRRMTLREVRNGEELSSFALRVLAVAAAARAGDAAPVEPGAIAPGIDALSLPFAGPPGHFRQISYVDVLRGNAPAGFFRDKIVLVGATATGLVGRYATPVSGLTQTMSGVEIQANAIDALRRPIVIDTVPPAAVAAATVAALALLLFLLRQASARAGLVLTIAGFLMTLVTAVILLRFAQLWYAPAAGLVGCALAYPVWSWRRLEAAQIFLDVELLELQKEPILLGQNPPSPLPAADRLERRLDAVRVANASRRRARRFLSDAVDSLPVGMIVADAQRRVVLANRRATMLLRRDGPSIIGEDIGQVVAAARGDAKESDARSLPADGETPDQFEMTSSSDGRPLLVGIARSTTEEGDLVGYIVSMADIADLRSAQHTRDEMLRFLSHDLRAPLASIISMIDVMQEPGVDASGLFTLDRVQELARRALDLADDFMRLARAEALSRKQLRSVDLAVLVAQAADEALALANVKKVRMAVATDAKPGSAFVLGDADLLRRALINLLNNAVRHSPEGEAVSLSLTGDSQWWRIAVADRGPGLSAEQISELFARYVRFNAPGARGNEGVGLGLVIVKAVAEKHGGKVAVESSPGEGACFIVTLPRKVPDSEAARPQVDQIPAARP